MTLRARVRAGFALAVTAITIAVLGPRAITPADAGWSGSLDRVSRVSAPDMPSRVVADAAGVAIAGISELRVVDANGDERWSAWFGDQAVLGPVAMSPKQVVVTVDDVMISALSRLDGTPQWDRPANDPWDVAIGTGADGSTQVGSVNRAGLLEVLDGASGRSRWASQLPIVGRVLVLNLRLVGTRVVVAWGDGHASRIRTFDLETGQPAWADDRASYASMPAVTDRIVAFAVNDGRLDPPHPRGRVHVLDLMTGIERWAQDVRGIFVPTVAAAASRRVVAVVDLKGTVTTIDLRTHEVRWRARTGRKQAEADPRVVGRDVAMTTYGTGLQVLDGRDGRPVPNDEPGVSQTEVTIVASATSGRRLYLLVQVGRVRGELWNLEPS